MHAAIGSIVTIALNASFLSYTGMGETEKDGRTNRQAGKRTDEQMAVPLNAAGVGRPGAWT